MVIDTAELAGDFARAAFRQQDQAIAYHPVMLAAPIAARVGQLLMTEDQPDRDGSADAASRPGLQQQRNARRGGVSGSVTPVAI